MQFPVIFVVIDGGSDGLTNEKTAFEVARTENLSYLIKKAKTGLVYPIAKNVSPESDAAALSLLGYDPRQIKVSRGVLEALGADIEFNDGDLALRCNFATVDKEENLVDRRVGRNLSDEEAKILVREINEKLKLPYEYVFLHTIGHRCVLVIKQKGNKFKSNISNIDPAYVRVGDITYAVPLKDRKIKLCEAFDEESKLAANIVNYFYLESRKILESSEINKKREKENLLKANAILLRDAGSSLPNVKSFKEKFNLKGVCFAEMPVEIGVAKLIKMDVIKLEYIKDYRGYIEKVKRIVEVLSKYDFIYVHLKGPDEYAHDGNFDMKVKSIEEIDEYFFGELLKRIDISKVSIIVTCDHSTPPSLKSHSSDPVPFMVYAPEIIPDNVKKFTEKECLNGTFGIIEHGFLLLEKLIK